MDLIRLKPMIKIEESVVNYLHALRDSGAINMFQSADYLIEEFGFSTHKASKIAVAYTLGDFEIIKEDNND